MTDEEISGTDLVLIAAIGDAADSNTLRDVERQISEVARLAEGVDASIREADEAATAATSAKEKSTKLFQRGETIKALQDASVAAAEAVVSLAESQKSLFENQQALAQYIRELTAYALGSVANTRLVYGQLRAKLQGASAGELNELAERELRRVMLEFKHQLDLAERQEQTNKRLFELREQLASQRSLTGQTAEIARSNAVRVDAIFHDLDRQREVDGSFADSLQTVSRRLDEVELRSTTTATTLAAEAVHGEQRDESIAQQVARLRVLVWIAVGTAIAGVAVGVGAVLVALLP